MDTVKLRGCLGKDAVRGVVPQPRFRVSMFSDNQYKNEIDKFDHIQPELRGF
jgi:hypothetical protein